MKTEQLSTLVCPKTLGKLTFDEKNQELISEQANLAYPVRNGIPVMLEEEARDLNTRS